MLKVDYYRQLASTNKLIADIREKIEEQKARVLELDGRPSCVVAVQLLRTLDRSMRLMTHYRAKLIRQLIYWPDEGDAQNSDRVMSPRTFISYRSEADQSSALRREDQYAPEPG